MKAARLRFWIGFALLAALWLLALVAGGRDSAFDTALYRLFYVEPGTTFARNSIIFTQIGSGFFLLPLALVAAAYLVFRRKRRAAVFLLMTIGGRFLVEVQKLIIDRPRPGISPHLVAADTYSFPSGHAANSMITFLAIALLLPVHPRNRAIAVGLAIAFSLQTGASRVMLGVHWPTDVIGGWAFGALWVITCRRLASARPEPDASGTRT
jgi:undecaprenyl-diphosphatase